MYVGVCVDLYVYMDVNYVAGKYHHEHRYMICMDNILRFKCVQRFRFDQRLRNRTVCFYAHVCVMCVWVVRATHACAMAKSN